MAKLVKEGDVVHGYRVTKLLNRGAMATSYAAMAPSGDKVFLKQYKSPSVTVPWYRDYVAYQQELKRRVEGSGAQNFSYRMIEFFEADYGPRTFFQVFEFIQGDLDMEKVLGQMRSRPGTVDWEQRVILSKILTNAVASLHSAAVVHCDLKPANIQLFPDKSIRARYQLKIIDMDFSVLADKPAPWQGQSPYVGSPHYFSPEHLSGVSPQPASDVFTCGLILYELLGGTHPYWTDDDDAYARNVMSHKAKPPRLAGPMPAPAANAQVEDTLYQCLCSDPARRPTIRNVNLVLNGQAPDPAPPPVALPARPAAGGLELVGEGVRLAMRVRTSVGRDLCGRLGGDAKYWSPLQFVIDRKGAAWVVIPNLSATNETLLNGRAITTETPLNEGDVLAVGREAKGIAKLPLRVHLT